MLTPRSFEFEYWDRGRLTVNSAFAGLLATHGLTTVTAFGKLRGGEVAKPEAHDRVTRRFVLGDGSHQRAFYLKTQSPPRLSAYVKPLTRLTWPIVGVTHEWKAMIRFHQLGIPTMVPVAMGRARRRSFLFTEALEGFQKLSQWMQQHLQHPLPADLIAAAAHARAVARVARAMHGAGLHHQDFYLGHLLVAAGGESLPVHVIDLGRVRQHRRLSKRWIIKDLAQLNYSASLLRCTDRVRFLRTYFDRRLAATDRGLIRRVLAKSKAIAHHSHKHGL